MGATKPSGNVTFALSKNFSVGLTRRSTLNVLGGTSILCVRPMIVDRLFVLETNVEGTEVEVIFVKAKLVCKPLATPSANDEARPGTEARSDLLSESSYGFSRRAEDFESDSENLNRGLDESRTGRPKRRISFMEAIGLRPECELYSSSTEYSCNSVCT